MKINYKLIGRRVRIARDLKKMSQARLAELIERSDSYISNIETAKSKIGLETLVRIANVLQVSTDYLLGGNLLYNRGVDDDLALLLGGCTTFERQVVADVTPRLIESLRANGGLILR